MLRRHIKTVETFEELIKQIKQWLDEVREKTTVIKEIPESSEPEELNQSFLETFLRSSHNGNGGEMI